MSTPVLSALRAFPIPDPTSSVLSAFDAIGWREWMPLGIAGIIVWTFWFYRPRPRGHRSDRPVA